MTYPTATQARHDALACVDGPVFIIMADIRAAIARAQWAAVREALWEAGCAMPFAERGDCAESGFEAGDWCGRCRLLADAERHLDEEDA